MRMIPLLSTLLLFLSFCEARAATHVGPVLTYQQFHRSVPENTEVLRWGGGLRLATDLIEPLVALELEALYTSEHDSFPTANTFDESLFRGRTGLLFRFFNASALHFGLRGGLQYSIVKDDYHLKQSSTTQ